MYQFLLDSKIVLILSTLTLSSSKSYTPALGPCASVRCGFNTRCFEFHGKAGCYNTSCSNGEIFRECSSYCEVTCKPQNIGCIQSCGPPACQCQPGFVRDNGKCVHPKFCSNLKHKTKSYSVKTARCVDVRVKCKTGHHCEDTRTSIRCAPDPVCPANEVFKICASDCEPTCVPMGRPCTQKCLPPKCQCKDGFVRMDEACIEPTKCSKKQLPLTTTPSYVDEPLTPSPASCSQALVRILCIKGCHCEIVDRQAKCLRNAKKNEISSRPRPQPLTCATFRKICEDGTHSEITNGQRHCVENPACVPNEEFRRCSSCEPTCGPIVPCMDVCQPPACQCVGGYVRDNGKCIRRTDCKTHSHSKK